MGVEKSCEESLMVGSLMRPIVAEDKKNILNLL
jgi:hypothetical protein